MPWKESKAWEERKRFMAEGEKEQGDFSELCRRYGVSRPTGYGWGRRYQAAGPAGLEERSRAARHCPHALGEEVAAAILARRRQHPRWGPRKLRAYLQDREPEQHGPAVSSRGRC
jgi:transposase